VDDADRIHPAIAWPGFDPERAFVLPLEDRYMATPFGDRCEIAGVRLLRKTEFHVTVLNGSMSRAAAAGYGKRRLRALYASLAWIPLRSGRYELLHATRQQDEGGTLECWSLIEHLQLPAMLAFRARLALALGPAFADPVPHVTHYVHGDPNGIGVPDRRALDKLQVRQIVA
jgi:hypothetical protein